MTHDTRVWMYRDGEARMFNHRNEVPAGEGWVDSPAKIGDPVAADNEQLQGIAAEAEAWRKATKASEPAAFEAFLKEYPNGVYAEVARFKLDQMPAAAQMPAAVAEDEANADDGKDVDPDGHKPPPEKPEADDIKALRAEYERLYGRKAFNGWNADKLRKKIDEARQ